MRYRRLLLVLALQLILAVPAPAGIFFNRKPKPAPMQRVPELLGILRGDPNDGKREAAAEELRQYDPQANPEIVPVLIDAALRDPKPEVRGEAVQTLGKYRPVSQEVGMTLEQILANDSSTKVRWHARTALWQYQLSGYRTAKGDGPPIGLPTNQEPPLAEPAPKLPTPQPGVPRLTPVPTTAPAAQPLPIGPGGPVPPAPVQTPPATGDGPALK